MNHTAVDSTVQNPAQTAHSRQEEPQNGAHSTATRGAVTDLEKVKDVVAGVVSGTLFDSGLLQKYVARSVEQKLEAQGQDLESRLEKILRERGAHLLQSALSETLSKMRRELQALVEKECAATLSSENLKILIDDKFRAISIYLKTDVIPKTVSQMLKGSRKPGGA